MMHHVPQSGLTALAVAGPVERGVRPHCGQLRTMIEDEDVLSGVVIVTVMTLSPGSNEIGETGCTSEGTPSQRSVSCRLTIRSTGHFAA